jgi:hypothetical protein
LHEQLGREIARPLSGEKVVTDRAQRTEDDKNNGKMALARSRSWRRRPFVALQLTVLNYPFRDRFSLKIVGQLPKRKTPEPRPRDGC